MKKLNATVLIYCLYFQLCGQKTTINEKLSDTNQLDEVITTATKTLRKYSNLTVPASFIKNSYIKQTGNLFLTDVLREQTGLNVVSYFGDAVQLQGLSSEYTLILLNGEPLVGRFSGTLDLGRISIANIKKIEIVKGPSSSLYGSEALAGVINIITENAPNKTLQTFLRLGTLNQIQANLQGATYFKTFSYNGAADLNRQDGYTLKPYTKQQSITPVIKLSSQHQLKWTINSNNNLSLFLRYNYQNLQNNISVSNIGTQISTQGKEQQKDFNSVLQWFKQINRRWQTQTKAYYTNYSANQNLANAEGKPYLDLFSQNFLRLENQTNYKHKNIDIILGAGSILESVETNRYDTIAVNKTNQILYVFTQTEWNPLKNWTIIGGIRYDKNQLFASAVSPKISSLLKLSKQLSVRASIGRGFKAPDFRQLYLNFTNNAAGSYSVYGANLAVQTIDNLLATNQILALNENFSKIKQLVPEFSTGINLGFNWNYNANFQTQINFFYNSINNFIDTRLVALKSNGSQIFSYLNILKIYTRGLELEINKYFQFGLQVQAGYQFLQTADLNEVELIKKGLVYTSSYVNGHLITQPLKLSDYLGLPNRSPHQANLKILYNHPNHWFANARVLYRSAWAFNDNNGNGVYDIYDELVQGNFVVNLGGGITLKRKYILQAGLNNLFNYNQPQYQPNLYPRNFFITFNYNLN